MITRHRKEGVCGMDELSQTAVMSEDKRTSELDYSQNSGMYLQRSHWF